MSARQLRERVAAAWLALDIACDEHGLSELLARAERETAVNERAHQRFRPRPPYPRAVCSERVRVRFQVLRWVRDPIRVTSALEAVRCTPQSLYGSAINEALCAKVNLTELLRSIEGIEYSDIN